MSKKVIITGANGGFGKLTVKSLLQNGHSVAATMRNTSGKNTEVAKELKNLGASVIEVDVTNDDSVRQGVAKAISELGGLDVVVNNAGIGTIGMQEHFTTDDFHKLFEVNVFGVQRVNRAVLPHFRTEEKGLIIYISSILGRSVIPFFGPYNASKAAIESLAENYRVELSGFGIENAIVEPGPFSTSFSSNLMQPSDQNRMEHYDKLFQTMQQMGQGFEKVMTDNKEQNPQRVADSVVALIETRKGEVPFRTVVDYIGMGDLIKGYNDQLEDIMTYMYGNLNIKRMLKVK